MPTIGQGKDAFAGYSTWLSSPIPGGPFEMENPEEAFIFFIVMVSTKKLKTQKRNSYHRRGTLGTNS